MNNPSANRVSFDGPAVYRIRVSGEVPARWSDRLAGMSITVEPADEGLLISTLTGNLEDQASLVGVLNLLYELQLPVLTVEYLSSLRSQTHLDADG